MTDWPWESELNDREWLHAGCKCRMVRIRSGAWSGYVGVTEGHPCFGMVLSDLPDLNVHGGVTLVRQSVPPGTWWICFDCAHDGDFSPASIAHHEPNAPYEVYRDYNYVVREVESLAEQLTEIKNKERCDD